ncbi:hypothetical protein LPJ66_000501 [Kickxella alabastrina]|uniref:Uncharacterized protein n=1 Tax=Kickxella alabastrina TaxID=61397 RepID=A0ACC1IVX1_9FUNG|nr:hypothetical protein LPJ66_000501 [Kickxella alabastrina]
MAPTTPGRSQRQPQNNTDNTNQQQQQQYGLLPQPSLKAPVGIRARSASVLNSINEASSSNSSNSTQNQIRNTLHRYDSDQRGTKRSAGMNNPCDYSKPHSMLSTLSTLSTMSTHLAQGGRQDTGESHNSGSRRSSMSLGEDLQQQQQQQQRQRHARRPESKRHHHDNSLKAYSLAPRSTAPGGWCETQLPPPPPLWFDAQTQLPAQDIVDELLSHTELEFNMISKVIHPRAFLTDYHGGRVSAFLLLTVMANNTMYSTHRAILALGVATATKMFIDRAKAFAPDAFEHPGVCNCQALLLLTIAYMHQGMLDVASHYSSATLKILEQLGVCRIDDSAFSSDDEWISESSWLDREQIRRVIWASFTVDTFLSLMMHKPPCVPVDLSGVNRPCAPTMWYVGMDAFDSSSFPKFKPKPEDTAYVTAIKQIKMGGMPWRINGATVQLNFAMLGNAILKGVVDPYCRQDHLDRLVANAHRSLMDWVGAAPEMPSEPTFAEVQHTLMLLSAALCLKSVVTPYLISRSRCVADDKAKPLSDSAAVTDNDAFAALGDINSPATVDRLLTDFLRTACNVHRYARLSTDMINNNVPPMFLAHSLMISGGMLAACAHSAPTMALRDYFAAACLFIKGMCRDTMRKSLLFRISLREIECVEDMVRYLPRRLDTLQLEQIRDALVPESMEKVVNKRFRTLIGIIREITRMPPVENAGSRMPAEDDAHGAGNAGASLEAAVTTTAAAGASTPTATAAAKSALSEPRTLPAQGSIPLTSDWCAIFGRRSASASASHHLHNQNHHHHRGGGIASGTSIGIGARTTNLERSLTMTSDTTSSDKSDAAYFPLPLGHEMVATETTASASVPVSVSAAQAAQAAAGVTDDVQNNKVFDCKLTFTAISSVLVALSVAAKEEDFFEFLKDMWSGGQENSALPLSPAAAAVAVAMAASPSSQGTSRAARALSNRVGALDIQPPPLQQPQPQLPPDDTLMDVVRSSPKPTHHPMPPTMETPSSRRQTKSINHLLN